MPNPEVLAVRVADGGEKQLLLDADPEVYFTRAPLQRPLPCWSGWVPSASTSRPSCSSTPGAARRPKLLVRAYDAEHPT